MGKKISVKKLNNVKIGMSLRVSYCLFIIKEGGKKNKKQNVPKRAGTKTANFTASQEINHAQKTRRTGARSPRRALGSFFLQDGEI